MERWDHALIHTICILFNPTKFRLNIYRYLKKCRQSTFHQEITNVKFIFKSHFWEIRNKGAGKFQAEVTGRMFIFSWSLCIARDISDFVADPICLTIAERLNS